MDILASLNNAQRQAVCAPPGHYLVLAGAGSGKTRVLVHRIAWLVAQQHASPMGILAVTFTNKAATAMRQRIEHILGYSANSMWVGTFHGLAHRLLRMHAEQAGLSSEFQILDAEDQQRLIKRIMKEHHIDDTKWPPKQAQGYINSQKDQGLRAKHIEPYADPYSTTMLLIYREYEAACRRAQLVDFAELLLRAYELWRDHPDVLAHYQARFRFILVDEFQDTNAIQYAWLRLLAGTQNHLMIVGDDDQSIYGWRGAKIENIQRFSQDFSGATTIRLEQNYRSTGHILNAANALIANNVGRLGKDLWTEGLEGEPVSLYQAFNELDEARFISERIKQWKEDDALHTYQQVAILYRSNAQSRVLEAALRYNDIPYRIFGGQRFFERAEIKDALAYLRLVVNSDNDAAFERVVNWPTRGIGDKSLEKIREQARMTRCSLYQSAVDMQAHNHFSAKVNGVIKTFIELITELRESCTDLTLESQIDLIIQRSGLITQFKKEKGEKGQARLDNLAELVTAARQFQPDELDEVQENTPAQLFLNHAALEAGEMQAAAHSDSVQLMTLHMAKGLEFPLVFLAGLEERLFPHQMALNEGTRLEEERRLCYVGMTRAMEKLYLTYAESRRLYGRESFSIPSRFISEIPAKFIKAVRLAGNALPAHGALPHQNTCSTSSGEWSLGQRVIHPKFGEGVVLNFEGQGAHQQIQVRFDNAGEKTLVVAYAKLESA